MDELVRPLQPCWLSLPVYRVLAIPLHFAYFLPVTDLGAIVRREDLGAYGPPAAGAQRSLGVVACRAPAPPYEAHVQSITVRTFPPHIQMLASRQAARADYPPCIVYMIASSMILTYGDDEDEAGDVT
jgi:hypothetical protein